MKTTTQEEELCSVEITRAASAKDGTVGITVKVYAKTAQDAGADAHAEFDRLTKAIV